MTFTSSDVNIDPMLRHQNFGATSFGMPSRRNFTILRNFYGIIADYFEREVYNKRVITSVT